MCSQSGCFREIENRSKTQDTSIRYSVEGGREGGEHAILHVGGWVDGWGSWLLGQVWGGWGCLHYVSWTIN